MSDTVTVTFTREDWEFLRSSLSEHVQHARTLAQWASTQRKRSHRDTARVYELMAESLRDLAVIVARGEESQDV